MITKTAEEKQRLKEAKRSFKEGKAQGSWPKKEEAEPVIGATFEIAEELTDDYPVHWDYLYAVDGKVIRSDIKGTVFNLKRHYKAEKVNKVIINF